MVHIESHEQRTDMTLTEWMAITGASSHYIPPEVERMNAWDEIIKEAKRQQMENRKKLLQELRDMDKKEKNFQEWMDAELASHKN
jgi:transcription initiation factor TFIID subunit TAF12